MHCVHTSTKTPHHTLGSGSPGRRRGRPLLGIPRRPTDLHTPLGCHTDGCGENRFGPPEAAQGHDAGRETPAGEAGPGRAVAHAQLHRPARGKAVRHTAPPLHRTSRPRPGRQQIGDSVRRAGNGESLVGQRVRHCLPGDVVDRRATAAADGHDGFLGVRDVALRPRRSGELRPPAGDQTHHR